jgi:hypothetical protein
MRYGDRLRNGGKVLEFFSSQEISVVLAELEDSFHPYATWEVGKHGDTYWGHYFSDYMEAHNDLLARADLRNQY